MIRGFLLVFWITLSVGALSLLIGAMETKSTKPCNGVHVTIEGSEKGIYVDQKDVLKILNGINGVMKGKPMKEFDLIKMEEGLEKNSWIKNAELYFDNNRELQVKILERKPVARIFTNTGWSYYIDSNLDRMPLNDRYTPRLPVFTNFPSDKKTWKGKDSVLIKQVKDISLFLLQDTFWMAEIDQVDINPAREFEMVPKVGNHTVVFGTGEDIDTKFRKLYIFYDDVLNKVGWNIYSIVNLSYKDQVVATRKDVKAIRADTMLARQWVKQMIKNTKDQALADSARKKAIAAGISEAIKNANPSMRDEADEALKTVPAEKTTDQKAIPTRKTSIDKEAVPTRNTPVKKTTPVKPAVKPADKKPKAVMDAADDNKNVSTTSIKEQL